MAINENEVEGKGRKAIGAIKETVGKVTGNEDLEAQGSAEKTAGGFQAGVGKISRKVEEAVDDAKRELKKPL
ncbi:MAG TPA: CsbD family protein [Thermoanaerobaculia bacterium]|nr:CsbD family protein [Thermoanaerobaculia bacterium]